LQELKNIQLQQYLKIFHHQTACGQSTALHTGIRAATTDWIVTLDGDGQNDPADIPKLLAEIPSSPSQLQLIMGMRVQRHDHWLRRWSSKSANTIRAYLLKDNTPDTGCGLKLIQREAFLALPYFDHLHRFLPALIQRNGGTVKSVAVNHRPRVCGRSHYGIHNRLWIGIIDLLGVLWLQRRIHRPIIVEVTQEITAYYDAQ
jgi:dolichol-phosphate mannosyltransferase